MIMRWCRDLARNPPRNLVGTRPARKPLPRRGKKCGPPTTLGEGTPPLDLPQIPGASVAQDALPASEDQELVQAVLRKDRKATALFVEKYADSVYGYVRSRLAPRGDLADDLVQDVFLAAWEAL